LVKKRRTNRYAKYGKNAGYYRSGKYRKIDGKTWYLRYNTNHKWRAKELVENYKGTVRGHARTVKLNKKIGKYREAKYGVYVRP
tara:strand:+ start:546 stop:797 length:252 start_codon:yes stop_codon:yes gene_type:complete